MLEYFLGQSQRELRGEKGLDGLTANVGTLGEISILYRVNMSWNKKNRLLTTINGFTKCYTAIFLVKNVDLHRKRSGRMCIHAFSPSFSSLWLFQ